MILNKEDRKCKTNVNIYLIKITNMKKIAYLIILTVAAFSFTACEDNNNENEGTKWNYENPFFEFEYATDTISLGSTMKISVDELKEKFLAMATSRMKDYFRGIDFYSADTLLIKAQMASGEPLEIHAHYTKNDRYIEVKLNPQDMAELMGEKAGMIPTISFSYFMEGKQMTIYFDEIYVQSLFENIKIQNMLLPMLARTMNPQFDTMPQEQQERMLAGLKAGISTILENIQTLKIGFVLTSY